MASNYFVVEQAALMARPEMKWPDHLRGSRCHSNPVGGVERQSEGAESDCLPFLSIPIQIHMMETS